MPGPATTDAEDVLRFWFGDPPRAPRPQWFSKSQDFDGEVRERFEGLHRRLVDGELDDWLAAPRSALAYVIVADQFPRNMYRETRRAFESDHQARQATRRIVDRGWDLSMHPLERQFVYLPLQHAEDIEAQREAVRRVGDLEHFPETEGGLEWAEKHHAIIARFRRFPHRNAALGRANTVEEESFLLEPGSRF